MATAIAYTCEFILPKSGEVLPPGSQAEIIARYAAQRGIEIVAWFSDNKSEEALLTRPGIRELLDYNQPYGLVICERTWALSRSMAVLEPFLKEVERRGAVLECIETTWDFASQQCRRRSRSLPALPRLAQVSSYRVAKPVRLNFVQLVHHTGSSVTARP